MFKIKYLIWYFLNQMIVKKIISLFFCSIIISCSNFEFVYDFPSSLKKLQNKTLLSLAGDDIDIINSYLLSKLRPLSENKDYDYILIIYSEKNTIASVIEKDATASKFNIEYKINYYLKNRKENCTIITKSIRTNSSYDSKSEGYSFGSDLSEKEVSTINIHSNIDDFINNLSILKNNLSCKNES